MTKDPFFSFAKWTPAQIKDKAEKALVLKKKAYEKVGNLPKEKQNFDSVIRAIEQAQTAYGDLMHPIDILNNLSPDKKVRDVTKKISESNKKKSVDIVYNKKVFEAIKYVHEHEQRLSISDAKLLDEYYSSYKRMGFDLSAKDFKRVKEINKTLSKIASDFDQRLNDWDAHIWVTRKDLDGMSEHYINGLEEKNGKYKITLQYPHLYPFLAQATNASKRKELADLQAQKGGKQNVILMEKAIVLRKELARLLGYATFVDYQVERRMSENLKNVTDFEYGLLNKLSPFANKELEIILEYKKTKFKDPAPLKYYEVGYLIDQYKKEYFSLDSKIVREYFELNHVIKTLIKIVKKLFGITLTVVKVPVWHEDVFVLEAKAGARIIGYVVVDLFPREGKYGHAMACEIRNARQDIKGYTLPIFGLVCNFAKPSKDSPSIISHGDVETLFHEFGHVLHAINSKQPYASLGGFQVAWDFVEVPSQFFEQWVWNKDIIKMLGKHYKTGKAIPDELIDKMLGAKNFMEAHYVMGQLVMGLFDLDIHTKEIKNIVRHNMLLREKYGGISPSPKSLFPASFGHLMHGYEAGYYSYLWSLVYANDLFGEFKKQGILNSVLGKKYRKTILEPGASLKEIDMMRAFLGREPSSDAFLKELGIK